ncbi:MAG: hypothetical protein WBC51_11810 [Vicinamibacterales bacterium]
MEIHEVRRRIRAAIAEARAAAQQRQARVDTAGRDYEKFLTERAVPLFHTFASALAGEGLRFKVFTPAGSVRLVPDGASEDYIELMLDTSGDLPQVIGRTNRGRGRRQVTTERPMKEGADIGTLTDEDVLEFLSGEIGRFL